MLKFVILLSVVACAFGAAVPEGMLPQLDGRIVGGVNTTISKHPWQIALLRNNRFSCGGSIHKDNFIITAAHCVYMVSASVLKIRAGSTDWNTGGELVNVDAITIHDKYNPTTMDNDVALLHLESSLTYSSTIKPIGLATTAPANGAPASVSGWGTTSSGGSISTQLRSVDLKIVSEPECKRTDYGSNIQPNMICAYAKDKDACQGDSGGPLVSGSLLVGIVSWGYGCARPGYPGVYCSVAAVSEFFENATSSS